MIALRRQSIRSSVRTVTLLAALTSLLLTMLTPFVGTASAAPGDPGTVSGFITFRYDGADHRVDFYKETNGADVPLPGYEWDVEPYSPLFHLSCSATLVGTTATVVAPDDASPFPVGVTATIVDFDTTRVNNGGKVQQCVPEDFEEPQPGLTLTKSVDDSTVSTGDSFTYTIQVDSTGATTARDVVVTDQLDLLGGALTVTGYTPALCSLDDPTDTLTCDFGDIGAGESRTITITVSSGNNVCQTVQNGASAVGTNLDVTSNTVQVTIENCVGGAEIVKYDEEERTLDGASYELYLDDGDEVFEPEGDDGPAVGSCTLDADDTDACAFPELAPGWYWALETQAPDGYDAPAHDNPQLAEVKVGETTTFNFVNPRLPYSIDVTPETDVNPVGMDHDFLVTATEDGSPVAAGTMLDIDWAWDVAPDPADPGIIKVNGTDVTATNTTTCTTQDDVAWGADTVDGACIITVTSHGSAASGTLTATFDLPYQHGSGTEGPTAGGPTVATGDAALASIFDEGDKEWRGYRVDIEDPATNLAGDPHTFTVTVWEVVPGGGETLAGDVVVGATWTDGPAGSGITGDGTTEPAGTDAACTTASSGAAEGTCDFTVDSDNPGTGDLTITVLDGTIGTHAVTQTTFTDDDDVDTSKTWVSYRLWVEPDEDINQVGWGHDFDVHVQSNDGGGWENVDGATFTAPSTLTADDGDWSFDDDLGGDLSLGVGGDTCDDGTVDGTCTITVTSPAVGTVVLEITAVTVPFGDGERLVLGDSVALSAGNGEYDETSQKTWVDYGLEIGDDGVNLLGGEHEFTVEVTRDDGNGGAALQGALVNLTWDGPQGSTVALEGGPTYDDADGDASNGTQFSCTTDDNGTCVLVVDSDTTIGEGSLSVRSIEDPSVTDGDLVGGIDYEALLDSQDITSLPSTTKTWKIYKVTMSDDAINLVGDDHEFLVQAWEADSLDGDDPVWQTYAGADLDFGWTGPGDPDPTSCTTADDVVWPTDSSDEHDGACVVTVSSTEVDEGTLSVSGDEIGVADDDPVFLGMDGDDEIRTAPLASSDTATKTWIAIETTISPSSTNRVGSAHTFDVTSTILTPDGDVPAPAGTSLTWTFGDDLAPGGVVDDAVSVTTDCDDFTEAGGCTFEVNSTAGGALSIRLDTVEFTYEDLTFGPIDIPSAAAETDRRAAKKTWIDYALAISPQDATNLLPTDPDHPMVVTLSSQGGAAVDGQVLDLTLISDNGASIDDGSAAVEGPEGTWTSTGTCETNDTGQCDVVITADSPGTATLSASYDFETDDGESTITSSEFQVTDEDPNGQDADKRWTTYSVTVEADAVNLLGTPHTFTVTVMQDGDDPVSGAIFTQGEPEGEEDDASYVTISDPKDAASITGGTCFTTGTDDDGACTVEVDSTETTLATVEVNYLGEAASSKSSFFADASSKQWIDYRLDVDPDTADNLVDTDHEFTVTVEMDLGDETGWQAVPDGSEVTLELAGLGAITDVGAGGTIGEGGLTGTCLTVDGTCSVTITSPDAGQSSLTAEFVGTAAGEEGNEDDTESATFTDEPAVKNWVDYELVMSQDAVNPIGTNHTFTATLTVDTGDGFGPAGGEEVDFSLEGPGTVVEVENGTVDEDERGGTCTTDVDGTCNIVITSNVQGDTTVSASYLAEVGETTGTFADAAVKTWESNPAIDLVKDVDVTELPIGGVATYTYTITNTGDVTLSNVRLIDEVEVSGVFRELIELLGFDTTITLEPGESIDLTSFHFVTEDDLPGPIDNVATVTGEAPDGEEVSDTDDETVAPFGDPAIELDKVVAIEGADPVAPSIGVDPDQPGDTVIPYEFTVTNTGNVTLTDVTLTDIVLTEIPVGGAPSFNEAQQVEGVVIAIDLEDTTLAPAESTTGTLAYQVRAADVENSVVVNVAQVTGVDPTGTTVRDEDPAAVALVFPDEVPPVEEPEEPEVKPQVVEKPAPAPVLPRTGFDTLQWALMSALVAGMGALLLLSTRETSGRRRRDRA